MSVPSHLRVEHLGIEKAQALGIGERRPRLSWRLPTGAAGQLRYELRLDNGSIRSCQSDENLLVGWPGAALTSGERRTVQVRVETDLGWSDWSEPLAVEAGLLETTDWQGVWVSPTEPAGPAGARSVYRLRGEFVLDRPVLVARLYATAHGIYEPRLDGVRVGVDELAPGYTEYGVRTQVQTYDVTDLLTAKDAGEGGHGSGAGRPVRHVIGALLADGWYRGQVGMMRAHDQWGEQTAFLAQLRIDYVDGTMAVIGTDGGWRWAPSHVLAADLIEGQREDRRLVEPDWCTPSYDAAQWHGVAIHTVGDKGGNPYSTLVCSPAPPVRAVEEIRPVTVTELRPGVHVVDLGQNINGRLRLSDLGPDGTELRLTHGEWLGGDGDVTTEHLRPDVPFLPEPLGAGQVDTVISAGVTGDTFEPRFTTHGFQYARIEGHPGPLSAEDITGVVVHTALEPRGTFSCSDSRLDRLHAAAVWSLRGNACDIPTDCPTRERAGWTGDWQLYVPTASYLFDVAGFSLKWLRDLVAMQWQDGTLGNMAPMPPAERTGFVEKLNGSAGWGDAVVLVPWELYHEYGDLELLEEFWPAMVAWLDRMERMATTTRHPDRVACHPQPRPHEKHLWDSGFHWGEWLEPDGGLPEFPAFLTADKAEVATAFYAWSTRLAALLAGMLGKEPEAERYRRLSDAVVDAWRTEFLDEAGRVVPHTQANLVRALRFGLLSDDLRQQAADDLADLVRAADAHLGTGFLATPDLLPMLADHGHTDLAYAVLLQDTSPSWLTMIERDATTVWERWDGVDSDGVPHDSLNHYSKGAVVSFLHRYVAGLQRIEPTWRRFRVQPRPGGGITWARTEHLTPHGVAAVSWRLDDAHDSARFELTVTVPPGCVAEVVLPDGAEHEVGPGVTTLG